MSEWFKVPVLKTGVPSKGTESSNLSLSANSLVDTMIGLILFLTIAALCFIVPRQETLWDAVVAIEAELNAEREARSSRNSNPTMDS